MINNGGLSAQSAVLFSVKYKENEKAIKFALFQGRFFIL